MLSVPFLCSNFNSYFLKLGDQNDKVSPVTCTMALILPYLNHKYVHPRIVFSFFRTTSYCWCTATLLIVYCAQAFSHSVVFSEELSAEIIGISPKVNYLPLHTAEYNFISSVITFFLYDDLLLLCIDDSPICII